MLELATLGAKILHNRSVFLAKKFNVPIVVRSSLTDEEGTVVKEVQKVEKRVVTGIAVDKSISRIALIGIEDTPGMAFKLFDELAKHDICIDIILQSIGRGGTKDISFTVSVDDLKETLEVLNAAQDKLKFEKIDHKEDTAKVSVVGEGMATDPKVASTVFGALYNAGINISMISTSEIRITVLVNKDDCDAAARALHDAFMPAE
jgi:aspartate kinase